MQPLFLFKVLGIPFFSYTTLVVIGIWLAWLMAGWQVSKTGRPRRWAGEAMLWIALFALLAGRLFQVLYNADYYLERPAEVLHFTDGGMSFVGVFCGGCVGLWWWRRRAGVAWQQAGDWASLPVAVLAASAWLGACLHGSQYGAPAENWMAMELRDTFGVVLARWPTQLLAAVWSGLIALALMIRNQSGKFVPLQNRAGQVTSWLTDSELFLVGYSAGMFVLDLTRGDHSIYILGLRLTQCLYLVLLVVAIFSIGRKARIA